MHYLRPLRTLVLILCCASLFACGDDDGGTGPTRSVPGDVTIRLSHMIVYGTCEGSGGFDQTGDFIVEMQILGAEGPLPLTPDPPAGNPGDLFEGAAGSVVVIGREYVLEGALADVGSLVISFEVSERDGTDLFDSRMRGSRGVATVRPDADGSWNGVTEVVTVPGASPCRVHFVVTFVQ
jgi:hypothetical protein